jgi:hypothetical protein
MLHHPEETACSVESRPCEVQRERLSILFVTIAPLIPIWSGPLLLVKR